MEKVTTLNSGYYAQDVPILECDFAEGGSVVFAVLDASGTQLDSWSEHYYPDASGKIQIHGLGTIAMSYLDTAGLDGESGSSTPWVTVKVTVAYTDANDDEVSTVYQTDVYYSRTRTYFDPEVYNGFLTRFTERTILPNQPVTFSLRCFGDNKGYPMLAFGVTWVDDDGALQYQYWKDEEDEEIADKTDKSIATLWYSLADLAAMAAAASEKDCEAGQIIKVTVELYRYYRKYTLTDSMVFNIDSGHQRQKSVFLYANCFGCPETVAFTGSDERTNALECELAYMSDEYRRSWSDVEETHTADSGPLNEEGYRACVDLATAPDVRLIGSDGSIGDKAVITAVNYVDVKPRTEPVRVQVTYRVTDRIQDRHVRVPYRVFDDSFDETFE